MKTIQVEQPGMLTTIQDLGRWGFGRFGMPVAGVMDEYAARVANMLLHNDEHVPVLEMTLMGPTVTFQEAAWFIVTGGDLGARTSCPHQKSAQDALASKRVPTWTVTHANAGDTLTFTGVNTGCRAYLAVAGGFAVKPVMGSASTYLRGKLGGYEGRALQAGDVLKTAPHSNTSVLWPMSLPDDFLPEYRSSIRVVPGPQDDAFTPRGLATFFSSEYTVSSEADRMGYKLEGPAIEHRHGADIISDGIALGAIQIPASGTPIIMMADHQTTGGYTKIGNVISVDIPSVAQKTPGERLRFEQMSVEDAQQLYRQREQQLERLRQIVTQEKTRTTTCIVTINGHPYHVGIREREAPSWTAYE